MKFNIPIKYIFTGLLLCCLHTVATAQLQCDNDTSFLRSLIDLKTGYYLDFQGGLYPGGSNEIPYSHKASGMNISRSVLPLNAAGNLDLLDGKAGFICLGASTAGNAFNHFKTKAEADPTVNPCLKIANCAVGAKGLEIMIDTVVNGWYWDDEIMPDVEAAGLSRYQVQVVWLMVTSRVDSILTWPYQPFAVTDKYEQLMPILLAKFPNLKEVFLSGFNYGGYADPTKEFYEMIKEPSSYWNNWSVKFLIENQIEGDPDLKFTSPDRKSPWLTWGPHLWADGMRANTTDGLRWNCAVDYKPDGGGYHMSNEGKDKEGKIIYDFFKNSPIAADWFNYGARWVSCDPEMRSNQTEVVPNQLSIYPNPANQNIMIEITDIESETVHIQLINTVGAVVATQVEAVTNNYVYADINVDRLPNGVYMLLVTADNQTTVNNVVVCH